jgi:protein-S-isoprenylcysteine O-methyltransferase Ste14
VYIRKRSPDGTHAARQGAGVGSWRGDRGDGGAPAVREGVLSKARLLQVPPPVWTFVYLGIARLLSALYPWRALLDLRVVWLGVVLLVFGAALSAWAFVLFRSEGTEVNPTSERNTSLVVRGPFRVTRNPMYLGLVIVTLGVAFWVGLLPMFAVPVLLFVTMNGLHIPFEEDKLRRQFGAAFDDYLRRVRRWI